MSYTMSRIFKSHSRNYFMPTFVTHEENSIDEQNPNHTCPLKFLCLLHGKCRLSQKSSISVLKPKSLVLVLGSSLSLSLESMLTSLAFILYTDPAFSCQMK